MAKQRKSYRLTETLCRSLEAPRKGNRLYFDSTFPGLALRVTAAGARAWVFCYRLEGREWRMTIGRFPKMGPAGARKKAKAESVKVDNNRNPLEERRANRTSPTLDAWGTTYLKEHCTHKAEASIAVDKDSIRKLVDHFGKNKRLKDLNRRDIRRFHELFKAQPRTGNKVLATLSHMFSCAISDEVEGIKLNPVIGIKRYPENRRDRFLHGEELQRFVEALAAFSSEMKEGAKKSMETRTRNKHVRVLTELRLIQFLLLTGARIGEATKARWSDIDFERGVWTKQSHHTKQKKTEHVPLSTAAVTLLLEWKEEPKRSESELIFPGSIPTKGVTYPRKTFAELKRRAKISDFKPHDLRHTYASQLVMSGKSLTIVGRLVGHTQAATTLRYAHLADDPLREATDIMGNLIGGMAKGKKAATTELRKRTSR